MNRQPIDAELDALQRQIAAYEAARPPSNGRLVSVRYRAPACPHCWHSNFRKRTSRRVAALHETHATCECKSCGRRFRLILDES